MRYLFYTYLALFTLKAVGGDWDGIASVENAMKAAAQTGQSFSTSSSQTTSSSQPGRGATDSLDSLYASIDAGYEKSIQQVNSGTYTSSASSAGTLAASALGGDVFSLNSDCWVKSCKNRPDYVQCIGQGPDVIAKASAQSPQRPLLCAEFAAETDFLAALGKNENQSGGMNLQQLLPMLLDSGEPKAPPDFVGIVPQD